MKLSRGAMLISLILFSTMFFSCSRFGPAPDPAEAAIAKQNAGDWKGAVEEWSKLITTDATNARFFSGRGYAKKRAGDPQGAVGDYSEAIRLSPTKGDHYAGRGDAYIMLADTTKGCEDLKKAQELGYEKASELLDKYCK